MTWTLSGNDKTIVLVQLSHLQLFLPSSSDPEGRVPVAASHSSPHTVCQCCVHGVSNLRQGAQLFPQPEVASAHPHGAHHSQLIEGHTLWPLFRSPLCSVLLLMLQHRKKSRHVEPSSWISSRAPASAFVQFTAKRSCSWLIIRFNLAYDSPDV